LALVALVALALPVPRPSGCDGSSDGWSGSVVGLATLPTADMVVMLGDVGFVAVAARSRPGMAGGGSSFSL